MVAMIRTEEGYQSYLLQGELSSSVSSALPLPQLDREPQAGTPTPVHVQQTRNGP